MAQTKGHHDNTHKVLHWPASHGRDKLVVDKQIIKRHLIRVAIAIGVFFGLNILLYATTAYITLPFTYINGINIGLMSRSNAIKTINQLTSQQTMQVTIDDQVTEVSYAELGIVINGRETLDHIRQVRSFGSLPLFQLLSNPTVSVIPEYEVDRTTIGQLLSDLIEPSLTEPTSAALIIPRLESEPLRIRPSSKGSVLSQEVAEDQVVAAIRSGSLGSAVVHIKPLTLTPAIHEDQLVRALQQANGLLRQPLAITNADGAPVTEVSTRTLRSMLTLNGTDLVFDESKLSTYLHEELSQYFFIPPKHRRISGNTILVAGEDGVQLDLADAARTFKQAILQTPARIALKTQSLEPATIADGVYPKTEMGLHALISDFDAERAGDYRIIVHQLTGEGLRATHQGVTSSIPASTYKAFIAYAAMWAAEQAEISLDDQTHSGTVRECIREMIHVSTDYCAFAIQDYMGWQRIDDILYAAGFENTKLNNEDRVTDKHITAQDEYKLFKGYYDGTLLSQEHTDYALDLFRNQKWRSGIPAGSSPASVANKVGFYNGWINDVGIVYSEKNDYILVALSDGGSFSEISNLSRRLYSFFEE